MSSYFLKQTLQSEHNYLKICTYNHKELIKVHHVDWKDALTRWALWTGRYLIHESLDLAKKFGQHDLHINALNKSITYLSSMLINIYRHSRSYPIKSLYKHYTSMELLICSFTQAWVNTDSFNKLYWVYLLCSYFTELFGGIYTSNIWIKTRKMFTVIVHRSVKRVKSKVLSITYEIFYIP